MINNAFVIKDLLANLLERDDVQISSIKTEFIDSYSITIGSKEVATLSLETTLDKTKVNFLAKFTEYRRDIAIPIVSYSRHPNDDDYELLHLVDFKYRQQLRLKEQTVNQKSINKFNTKWVKLKDFHININAISKISLSNIGYVEYVAIYTGDDRPELVETHYYNKWVQTNNLDLPIVKENSYEPNI